MIEIKEISFEEILPFWQQKLWPGRISKIEPMSALTKTLDIDMNIFANYQPTFWGAIIGDTIVGVNSGHRTSVTEYRSRGLWVDENWRNCGVAKLLLLQLINKATELHCKSIWTLPRLSSLKAYESVGFKSIGHPFDLEAGPNILAIKELKN